MSFREMAVESIRYWERKRLLYNAALMVTMIGVFLISWPISLAALSTAGAVTIFTVFFYINVAYCCVYALDFIAQYSPLKAAWLRYRWIVLAAGTLFGCTLTYFSTGLVILALALIPEAPPAVLP